MEFRRKKKHVALFSHFLPSISIPLFNCRAKNASTKKENVLYRLNLEYTTKMNFVCVFVAVFVVVVVVIVV